jgi:hypothetical protein
MNACLLNGAAVLVRTWTWIYTLPLDTATRRDRRHEIESDLWEFRTERWQSTPICAAIHTLLRLALGAPDDVLWTCEQLPDHFNRPRVSTVLRVVPIAIAASTLVVSASGPTLDPARVLKVNVVTAGWLPVTGATGEHVFVPSFAFTLTNVGDRLTSAIQVNALFRGTGAAFSPIVGWRGLAPGRTSHPVTLRGLNLYGLDETRIRHTLRLPRLDNSDVRLFVQHEGRWTLLGIFSVPAQRIDR